MAAHGTAGSQRRPPTRKKRREDLILDALERLLATTPMSELDIEPIAAEAGIARTRFYHYYRSKNDALAALLLRLADILREGYEDPDSWFLGRAPDVRPRESLRRTIDMSMNLWWPHRFVLREAADLWTTVPEVRDTWLLVVNGSVLALEQAIERERALGVAPPGGDAHRVAEALIWQAERIQFRGWARLPGAMSKKKTGEILLECWMRTIFLSDDPDPEVIT